VVPILGLFVSIILFNLIAFSTNKKLTKNQIIHIWIFTIAFQHVFDCVVDFKYHAYYYFSEGVDWIALPAHLSLIPPVNMMFLNWYPFNSKLIKRILYFIYWTILFLLYEALTTLPEPWGYFRFGWWKLQYSAITDPNLWIRSVEKGIKR